jgi:hypothetical protein
MKRSDLYALEQVKTFSKSQQITLLTCHPIVLILYETNKKTECLKLNLE